MLSLRSNSHVKLWRNREEHSERITKIKPFINKYNWEEIDFSSEKDDWKTFEKKNVTIALNVLYAKKKKKYVLPMFQNIQNIIQIVKNKLLFSWFQTISIIKKNKV